MFLKLFFVMFMELAILAALFRTSTDYPKLSIHLSFLALKNCKDINKSIKNYV